MQSVFAISGGIVIYQCHQPCVLGSPTFEEGALASLWQHPNISKLAVFYENHSQNHAFYTHGRKPARSPGTTRSNTKRGEGEVTDSDEGQATDSDEGQVRESDEGSVTDERPGRP